MGHAKVAWLRHVTTLLSGTNFVVRRLGLTLINLSTKFEASTVTQCELAKIQKATESVEIGVVWGG